MKMKSPNTGCVPAGWIHPKDVLTNAGCQVGDALVLTKALGTGILSAASKADLLSEEEYRRMVELMTTLNRNARDCMIRVGARACTDITGFGLLGHAYEMAVGSGMTVVLDSRRVPIVPKALELAREGIIPSGAYNNMGYIPEPDPNCQHRAAGGQRRAGRPQAAGGLLIALPEHKAPELLSQLEAFTGDARMVGYVKPFSGKSLEVR